VSLELEEEAEAPTSLEQQAVSRWTMKAGVVEARAAVCQEQATAMEWEVRASEASRSAEQQ
jgi:hypothetical protein